jgi:hypothetical protein
VGSYLSQLGPDEDGSSRFPYSTDCTTTTAAKGEPSVQNDLGSGFRPAQVENATDIRILGPLDEPEAMTKSSEVT